MPYIKNEDRGKYTDLIESLVVLLSDQYKNDGFSGELNFVLSMIVTQLFRRNKRYKMGNDIIGALTGVLHEFYRKELVPYEDVKIKENGDI